MYIYIEDGPWLEYIEGRDHGIGVDVQDAKTGLVIGLVDLFSVIKHK